MNSITDARYASNPTDLKGEISKPNFDWSEGEFEQQRKILGDEEGVLNDKIYVLAKQERSAAQLHFAGAEEIDGAQRMWRYPQPGQKFVDLVRYGHGAPKANLLRSLAASRWADIDLSGYPAIVDLVKVRAFGLPPPGGKNETCPLVPSLVAIFCSLRFLSTATVATVAHNVHQSKIVT